MPELKLDLSGNFEFPPKMEEMSKMHQRVEESSCCESSSEDVPEGAMSDLHGAYGFPSKAEEKPKMRQRDEESSSDESSSEEGAAMLEKYSDDWSTNAASHSYRLIRLRIENEKLKQCIICKCCNVKRVQTLNLPCRHIVSCEQCADKLDDCCLCNAKILGTVRIFMC
jgi:hypothetical protein